MPIIKKNWTPRVYHKEGQRIFNFDIYYDSGGSFYVLVPEDLLQVVELMLDEEKEAHSIKRIYKRGKYETIVHGATETEIYGTAPKTMQYLLGLSMVKRPVIVLFFTHSTGSGHSNNYNKEHQKIGLEIAIKYCVEILVGKEKQYATFEMKPFIDRQIEDRTVISVPKDSSIILEDTPENRVFVEDLYSRLNKLNEKLSGIITDPEKLMLHIASNSKLLN